MPTDKPIDLLVECKGCGVENFIEDFVPSAPAVCHQCRDNLIAADLGETHKQLVCQDCGIYFLLTLETEFQEGEAECRCGSRSITPMDAPTIEGNPLLAGDFEPEERDENSENFDWCRSAPGEPLEEDYNDIFNNDPGSN